MGIRVALVESTTAGAETCPLSVRRRLGLNEVMSEGMSQGSADNGHWDRVSFAEEPLILVDSKDSLLGHDTKASVHAGDGRLHRAFSIFLFADPQTVLLHKRSAEKPLWPGFWTNSCCSHPRRGEDNDTATQRRLQQELGVQVPLQYLYKFEYHAHFGTAGAEHELCSVYVGALDEQRDAPRVNRSEISEWGWFTIADISAWLTKEPEVFTPWFKLEWVELLEHHRKAIDALFQPPARLSGSAAP